ncbi:hypothetical protein OH492_01700 [Vibrio chagasii]|nr:hypothetical protein [Vibrio chagasii]
MFKHYLADGKDLPFSQLMSFPLYRELGRRKAFLRRCASMMMAVSI